MITFVPLNRSTRSAIPTNIRPAIFAIRHTTQELLTADGRLGSSKLDQRPAELNQVRIDFRQIPIQPTDFIVLAISIVVTVLSPSELVTSNKHWHALAKHQRGDHVFDLSQPQRVNDRLIGWTFDAKVLTEVIIIAVAIVFAVGQIVFFLVANQVTQRKTIVRRDEVNTITRWSPARLIKVCRPRQTSRQGPPSPSVAAPIAANIIAITTVPLSPAIITKRTNLIGSGGIPRFGNDFRISQQRVFADHFNQRWVRYQITRAIAAQDRSQIKSEAVDVIVVNPMTQAVKDHFSYDRVVTVDSVSAARVVLVVSLVRFEHVVNGVLEPFEADHWSVFVAFTSVIENHVQDHFDASFVQRFDHLLELANLGARSRVGCVATMQRKERH